MAHQDREIGPAAVRATVSMTENPVQISAYQTLVRYEIAFERQYTLALARLESLKAANSKRTRKPFTPVSFGCTFPEFSPTIRTEEGVENKESP